MNIVPGGGEITVTIIPKTPLKMESGGGSKDSPNRKSRDEARGGNKKGRKELKEEDWERFTPERKQGGARKGGRGPEGLRKKSKSYRRKRPVTFDQVKTDDLSHRDLVEAPHLSQQTDIIKINRGGERRKGKGSRRGGQI